ncbi:MAG: hypothetical protein JSV33_14345 [bacterium]|nr:MAG: hypothetical protein JSV33_14345 [bacterium]
MSGFFVFIGERTIDQRELEGLTDTINLSRNFQVRSTNADASHFAVSYLRNTPVRGERLIETDRWIALFSGDVIGHVEIPLSEIIRNIDSSNTAYFRKLEGIYAIAAYDKEKGTLYVVSDRRSQQPVYYYTTDNGIFVSTDVSTFCRLEKKPEFDETWLWEYLFFNYPVGDSTFLKDVRRIPPASIVEYDRDSREYTIHRYAANYRKADHLIDGKEALDHAVDVFARRMPGYFEGAETIACALTGGWDGRTLLALAPDKDITAYTYGIPGCDDLVGAGDTARTAKIKHLSILFDNEFTKDLPNCLSETVFLSSGLQGLQRATLLYAYRKLTERGRRFPITISGVAMDMQLRGHAHVPALVSPDMADIFESGKIAIRKNFWSSMLGPDYSTFEDHIMQRLRALRNNFGGFDSTEHHLSYALYIVSTRYFGGEVKIADLFTTLRVPVWDSEIIELSYGIKQSMLSFSQFSAHTRGDITEQVLQSYLLSKLAPVFARVPMGNTRPDIILRGKSAYQLYRLYRGVVSRSPWRGFRSKKTILLEDWNRWFNDLHREFIDNLIFSKEARIRSYVQDGYLDALGRNRNIHYIGKLATAEVILRLVENGWKRFW